MGGRRARAARRRARRWQDARGRLPRPHPLPRRYVRARRSSSAGPLCARADACLAGRSARSGSTPRTSNRPGRSARLTARAGTPSSSATTWPLSSPRTNSPVRSGRCVAVRGSSASPRQARPQQERPPPASRRRTRERPGAPEHKDEARRDGGRLSARRASRRLALTSSWAVPSTRRCRAFESTRRC